MNHLRFCCMYGQMSTSKENVGETRRIANAHPQEAMKELGITYQHSTPQTMGSQWWFWNCGNIPDKLPPFLEVMTLDPMKQIGWGLDKETAEAIRDYKLDRD